MSENINNLVTKPDKQRRKR